MLLTKVNGYGGVLLDSAAATAFAALSDAFLAHFGYRPAVTDSYRSYTQQLAVFTARYTTVYRAGAVTRQWGGKTWYLKPGMATAATPGASVHGHGKAVDLGSGINSSTTQAHAWMRENARKYGWVNPEWAQAPRTFEPWHWEYIGGYAPAPALPITESETDMPYIIVNNVPGHKQDGVGWIVFPQGNGKPRATVTYGDVSGAPTIVVKDARTWAGVEGSIQWA